MTNLNKATTEFKNADTLLGQNFSATATGSLGKLLGLATLDSGLNAAAKFFATADSVLGQNFSANANGSLGKHLGLATLGAAPAANGPAAPAPL